MVHGCIQPLSAICPKTEDSAEWHLGGERYVVADRVRPQENLVEACGPLKQQAGSHYDWRVRKSPTWQRHTAAHADPSPSRNR